MAKVNVDTTVQPKNVTFPPTPSCCTARLWGSTGWRRSMLWSFGKVICGWRWHVDRGIRGRPYVGWWCCLER